jgi:hypothetical protein
VAAAGAGAHRSPCGGGVLPGGAGPGAIAYRAAAASPAAMGYRVAGAAAAPAAQKAVGAGARPPGGAPSPRAGRAFY